MPRKSWLDTIFLLLLCFIIQGEEFRRRCRKFYQHWNGILRHDTLENSFQIVFFLLCLLCYVIFAGYKGWRSSFEQLPFRRILVKFYRPYRVNFYLRSSVSWPRHIGGWGGGKGGIVALSCYMDIKVFQFKFLITIYRRAADVLGETSDHDSGQNLKRKWRRK